MFEIAREHKVVGQSLAFEWGHCYRKRTPLPSVVGEYETEGSSILQGRLDSRVYIDLRCIYLSTPLHLALEMASDFPLITDKAHRLNIIKKVIESGADTTARDTFGMIPSTFNLEIVEIKKKMK
jgi:hypothetical protein